MTEKEFEDLKVKVGYVGKSQQWQYGFDLACRELKNVITPLANTNSILLVSQVLSKLKAAAEAQCKASPPTDEDGGRYDAIWMNDLNLLIDSSIIQMVDSNTKNYIYLVGDYDKYEAGFRPYFAFLDKTKATKFLERISEVKKTEPVFDIYDDDDDTAWRLARTWRKTHRVEFGNLITSKYPITVREIELKIN